jgi:hypothetical protein
MMFAIDTVETTTTSYVELATYIGLITVCNSPHTTTITTYALLTTVHQTADGGSIVVVFCTSHINAQQTTSTPLVIKSSAKYT